MEFINALPNWIPTATQLKGLPLPEDVFIRPSQGKPLHGRCSHPTSLHIPCPFLTVKVSFQI